MGFDQRISWNEFEYIEEVKRKIWDSIRADQYNVETFMVERLANA